MARRKRIRPRNVAYKAASAIDTGTEAGRCELWTERIRRAQDMLGIKQRREDRDDGLRYIDGTYAANAHGERVYFNEALPALEDLISTRSLRFKNEPWQPSLDTAS